RVRARRPVRPRRRPYAAEPEPEDARGARAARGSREGRAAGRRGVALPAGQGPPPVMAWTALTLALPPSLEDGILSAPQAAGTLGLEILEAGGGDGPLDPEI